MNIKHSKIKLQERSTLELTSWAEFINFLNENMRELKGCIYRGQRVPTWKLTPTIFRQIPKEYDSTKLKTIANRHLENFKKFTRGKHTISYTDPNDNDENWWALGQHYGLKTPLLDWVKSPYVAAFFSFIEEMEEEKKISEWKDEQTRAVFILDIEKVQQTTNKVRGGSLREAFKIFEPLTHENKRLVSQQGLLTYSNDFKYKNVESYLIELQAKCKDEIAEELFLLKITIPDKERCLILEHLDLMNINKSTLFPDLGGSAEYSNYLLEGMAIK